MKSKHTPAQVKSIRQETAEMGFVKFFRQTWDDCQRLAGPRWPHVDKFQTYKRIKAAFLWAKGQP